MRIRERAYTAFACLFFVVNNSLAQPYHYAIDENRQNHEHVQVIPANTTLKPGWDIKYLSQPKAGLKTVQSGNKVFFASQTECEVYDLQNGTWGIYELSRPRRNIRGAGTADHVYFAGGTTGPADDPRYENRVDIYNDASKRWTTCKLSEARITGAAGAAGNTIIFAGGISGKGYCNRADVFDALSGKNRPYNLSQARDSISVAVVNDKIILAGGETGTTNAPLSSNYVDVYEIHSHSWSRAKLSEKKQQIAIAVTGNKAIFAGGLIKNRGKITASKTVDIYDDMKGTWINTTLSEAKYGMATAVAGNKVYFAGGVLENGALTDKVEVYDVAAGTWSYTRLSAPCAKMATGSTSSRIMFAGGYVYNTNTISDRVDVLDLNTNTWSVEKLSVPRCRIAAASYHDKVIFAGGKTNARFDPGTQELSGLAEIWSEPTFEKQFHYAANLSECYRIAKNAALKTKQNTDWIYPDNEDARFVDIDLWKYETKTVHITVLDEFKRTVIKKAALPFGKTVEQIDISMLPAGSYWVQIESDYSKPVMRLIVLNKTDANNTGKIFAKI